VRYSISQVAKASGVSARMLRHYDAIGLLTPSSVAANGYRWYGRLELLRLQRILLLRRLGLGLAEIGAVLGEQVDEAAALRGHLAQLEDERRRLGRVITTVEETIADLDDARIDDPERFFAGLRTDGEVMRQTYRETFGEGAAAAFDVAEAALFRRLAGVMRSGVAPEDRAALDAVAEHYESVSRFWQPTAVAYAAMGGLYLSDPKQHELAARADPGLPAWLARAIEAYARERLVPPVGKS
jgi:DNA-binding transcriptional MerR regulator